MNKVPIHILANIEFEKISITVDLAEEREEQVKYRIRLVLESSEYIIYRDYRQFKSLHSSLRFQFPKIELPSFPSKYSLYNIKESRRKAFDKLLKSIVSMGKKLPSLSRKEIKRLLIDFLAEKNVSVMANMPKDEAVETEQIKSSSGCLMSFMDVKLDEEDWITYYASLIENDIYLYPDDSRDSYFSIVICILGTELVINEAEGMIEVHHPYEKKPILLKTALWKEWKDQLVVVSSQAGKSQDYKRKSIGRLIVKIYSAQNIKIKPVPTTRPYAYANLVIDTLKYQTSILPQDHIINWNQTFILPMFNRFFILNISIRKFSSENWRKQNKKEDLFEEIKIPIIDLNQYPYINGPLTINLEQDLLGRTKSEEDENPCLNLDVIHDVGFFGNFIPPPSNYVEDNIKVEKASLDDFKIISKRLKRIRIVYELFFGHVNNIFSWKYHELSLTSMICYIIIVLFIPSQFAIPLIILLVTIFCYTLSPYCENFRDRFRKRYLSNKTENTKVKILTQKESDFLFKKQFENFNEKDKDGILDTYKKIRVDIDELMEILVDVVAIAEKIRTIFLWEDPQKSLYFCIGLLLVVYLIYSIPFRLLVLLIGVGKFLDGKSTSKKLRKNNENLCKEVLSSLFSIHMNESNLTPLTETEFNQEFFANQLLQKKIVKGLRSKLALEIDIEIFEQCRSPKELFEAISSIEVLLKIRTSDGHIAERSKKMSKNPVSGFIANIPSEYYRFLHPRVKNISGTIPYINNNSG